MKLDDKMNTYELTVYLKHNISDDLSNHVLHTCLPLSEVTTTLL